MSDDRDVLEDVQRLIAELEAHPDPTVGQRVTALLQGIDAVHRTALTHLMQAIHGMAGDAFVNRLIGDPAIRLLLMSYDLVAVDRRLQAEEALDTVRGHLHGHGIDIELTDVVGGAVYAKVHGIGRIGSDVEAVRHDLEEALKAGLVGFQELVLGDREGSRPLLQVGGLRRPRAPVYAHLCATADVPPGTMKAVDIDGLAVLVVNVDGQFSAVANHCGDTPLPLQYGSVDGAELTCSWHGCRYDVRTGHRIDGLPGQLAVFPVAIEHDGVLVAIGVEAGR